VSLMPFVDDDDDNGALLRREADGFAPAPRGQSLTYQQIYTRNLTSAYQDEITGAGIIARHADDELANVAEYRQATAKRALTRLGATLDAAQERYGYGNGQASGSGNPNAQLEFRGSADLPALLIADTRDNVQLFQGGLHHVQRGVSATISNIAYRSLTAPEEAPPPPPAIERPPGLLARVFGSAG